MYTTTPLERSEETANEVGLTFRSDRFLQMESQGTRGNIVYNAPVPNLSPVNTISHLTSRPHWEDKHHSTHEQMFPCLTIFVRSLRQSPYPQDVKL